MRFYVMTPFFFSFFSFEHLLFCTYPEIRAAHCPPPAPRQMTIPTNNQRKTIPTKEGDKMQEIALECGIPRGEVLEGGGPQGRRSRRPCRVRGAHGQRRGPAAGSGCSASGCGRAGARLRLAELVQLDELRVHGADEIGHVSGEVMVDAMEMLGKE